MGDETLRFELQPDSAGTVLSFINTFGDLGKAARDGAGWHACLDLLECRLAGEPPPWSPGERWAQLHGRYVDSLGPAAATVGPPAQRTESA